MSFLTPLYIAGLLGISLPLVFHLIRRTPRGEMPFSSLMFLRASPPRLTRRSRLDQLFLLLLRVLALVLLSLAFARPFLRETSVLDIGGAAGRRVAILVDTSASMRRGDLWRQAVDHVKLVLDDMKPPDRVALFAFDGTVRTIVGFEDDVELDGGQQAALVRGRLDTLGPTWAATEIGPALVTVADALDVLETSDRSDAALEIVLISDLQEGSDLTALQAYQWPAQVRLDVKQVTLPQSTNAGLQVLIDPERPTSATAARVRVTNSADARGERFSVRWAGATGETVAAVDVYVPPGQSRVVRLPRPAADSAVDRVVLDGDEHDFDNVFHVAPLHQEEITVKYVGTDASDDPEGLRYFLDLAFADSPRRKVRIETHTFGQPLRVAAESPARLVVLTEAVPAGQADALHDHVQQGGTLLCVVTDAAVVKSLAGLLGADDVRATEASVGDYAMLSEVDFNHPLFRTFAAPPFSDFTRVHFWKYRRLELPPESDLHVVARFDDGDPFLVERAIGRGKLLLLTSGWHPADSQLALSSKFVPLLHGMLEENNGTRPEQPYYRVHESVALRGGGLSRGGRSVYKPDGSEVKLASDALTFDGADQPGIYSFQVEDVSHQFAVNLSPAESETAPMPVEELERHGARLGTPDSVAGQRSRQMRSFELENRQKIWRWLIAAAVGVLLIETWWAGRLARPATPENAP